MSKTPLPPPTDRPILAKWKLSNPAAPEWSESGELVISYNHGEKTWDRLSDSMPLRQASGDVLTILSWKEYILPASRAIASADGHLN